MEQLRFSWFDSMVNKESEDIYGCIRVPRSKDDLARSSCSQRDVPVQDVGEALNKAREALDRVRFEDLAYPASIDMRLDRVGAALIQVPRIKDKIKGTTCNSFGCILEELGRVRMVRRSTLKQLEKIESILAALGCHAAPSCEDWRELTCAVNNLCDDLNDLITELEFQAEEED